VSTNVLESTEITCVLRGSNNDLYSIQVDPRTGATLGFNIIGFTNSIAGNPACASPALAAAIYCAVRGLENELYGIIFDPVTLAGTSLQRLDQSSVARPLAGDPSCVSDGPIFASSPFLGPPGVTCGVRGKDNRFHVAKFSGGVQRIQSSSIVQINSDKVIVGDPSCALSSTSFGGSVFCAARAADSSLAVMRVSAGDGSDQSRFGYIGGPSPVHSMLGDPSCVSTEVDSRFAAAGGTFLTASPLVTCGVTGADTALYVIRFQIQVDGTIVAPPQTLGFDTLAYRALGGTLTGSPGCASTRSEVVTCGVRGTDGNLYLIDVHIVTGSSSTYDRQPAVMAADPACVAFGDEAQRNVACGVVGLNNGLSTVASVRPPVSENQGSDVGLTLISPRNRGGRR
jgi:hypothetical protein